MGRYRDLRWANESDKVLFLRFFFAVTPLLCNYHHLPTALRLGLVICYNSLLSSLSHIPSFSLRLLYSVSALHTSYSWLPEPFTTLEKWGSSVFFFPLTIQIRIFGLDQGFLQGGHQAAEREITGGLFCHALLVVYSVESFPVLSHSCLLSP